MPEAARGDGVDTVDSLTGSGVNCTLPVVTATDVCSGDVFVNGIGSVRKGDRIKAHPKVGCFTDTSVVTTYSASVFINNENAARKGDNYTSDNTISSGSPNVFIGDSGASSAGPNIIEINGSAPLISISSSQQQLIDRDIEDAISNPRSVGDTNNQVDSQYPVTPNSVGVNSLGTTDSLVDPNVASSTATADQIPGFLSQVLQEAANGQWDETKPVTGVSNPNIIGIWRELGFPETSYWQDDQTPWCAGFVNWVLKKTGYRFMQSARAFDFSGRTSVYGGVPVPLSQGQPGDIVVWDYSHVNFIYTVPSPGTYTFVGGNQSDRATTNNNPSNGSVTQSWPGGWTTGNGRIRGIYRPVRS